MFVRRLYLALLLIMALCASLAAKEKIEKQEFAYVATDSGQIRGFRVAKNGRLLPISGVMTLGNRPLTLQTHPNGRFLYGITTFDVSKDGFRHASEQDDAPPKRSTTIITTLAIGANGTLSVRQRLTVQGVLGGIIVHPSGKFLYGIGWGNGESENRGNPLASSDPGGIVVFRIGPKGALTETKRTAALHTFDLMEAAGLRDEWDIAFIIDGKYAWCFSGMGFIDHSENNLQRFCVKRDGTFAAAGDLHSDEPTGDHNSFPVGSVYFLLGTKFAVVNGFQGLTLCVIDKYGNLVPHVKSRIEYVSGPKNGAEATHSPDLYIKAIDPKGRFLYIGRVFQDTTTILYKVTDAAGAVPVQTFGGADAKVVAEIEGRFVYTFEPHRARPINAPDTDPIASYKVVSTTVTVYNVSKAGRLTAAFTPLTLPGGVSQVVFAARMP